MISSRKLLLICTLFLIGLNCLNAQYTTDNFSPTSLIIEGLKAPSRMAVDTNDHIYATDAIQKNIVKYDGQGNYITTITTTLSPLSIAINNKNQLFVGDKTTGSIYNVNQNGSKTLFYEGTSMPNSMVFGLNNILYIVDSQLKKVIGLDVSGTVVKEFTYDTFTFPTGIAFDKQNSHIIVSEHGGIGEDVQTCGGGSMSFGTTGPLTTIYIFDTDGNLINNFGCFGTKDGLFHRIQGVTVGTCGNIYAVDPYLGRVNVFDNNGNYITKFGLQGNGIGEFNLPMDIVFTSDNSAIVSSMNKGAIDVFSLTNNTLPTSTITSEDQTICANSLATITINLTGIAPWTFTYTVDGINPVEVTANEPVYNLSVSKAGFYEVTTLVDKDNIAGTCFTGGTNIKVNELPTATFLTADFSKCNDVETGVPVQFTGIAPWTFTYTIDELNPVKITTSESLYSIKTEKSGRYQIITLTDAGCSGINLTDNTNVTVNPLPTASITNENDFATIKPGESADFTIAFTGTAPYTFTYLYTFDVDEEITITTNENPYTLTVSKKGTYEILNITDQFCSNMNWQGYFDIYYIELPRATIITSDIKVCSGTSEDIDIYFTGEAPWTYSYTINGLNPTEITTSNNPYKLSTSTAGAYELIAFSDINGSGTFSGITTVNEFEQPNTTLPAIIDICEGNNTILDPGVFNSYLWSDGSTQQTLAVQTAGTYSVAVTDQNGCSAEASVEVIVNPLPSVDLGPDLDICETELPYVLDSGNYQSYKWSNGSNNRTLEVTETGNYSVTVINASGCESTTSINITVHPMVTADFYYEGLQKSMQFFSTATNADSHFWDFGDGNTSTEENPSHPFKEKGDYTVSYTAYGEFCSEAQKTELIEIRSSAIDDVIVIYPNPSNGEFTLKINPDMPITSDIVITIKSLAGQIIYNEVFNAMSSTSYDGNIYKKINLDQYSKGVYVLSIEAANFTAQHKLVLKD
ncbi:PKD domain-containing protein [Lutibacter sp.]|uniref:PKD domain-containing protein n=1 Tax=Lutibacter sp. TaxID=1925666 RepID=UPI00356978B4